MVDTNTAETNALSDTTCESLMYAVMHKLPCTPTGTPTGRPKVSREPRPVMYVSNVTPREIRGGRYPYSCSGTHSAPFMPFLIDISEGGSLHFRAVCERSRACYARGHVRDKVMVMGHVHALRRSHSSSLRRP